MSDDSDAALLTRYAVAVLRRWISSGTIRSRAATAGRGRPRRDLEPVPKDLRLAGDDAAGLAEDIVVIALRTFRSESLPSGDPACGTSLRNRFMSHCLTKLPDAYLRWQLRQTACRPTTPSLDDVKDQVPPSPDSDETEEPQT